MAAGRHALLVAAARYVGEWTGLDELTITFVTKEQVVTYYTDHLRKTLSVGTLQVRMRNTSVLRVRDRASPYMRSQECVARVGSRAEPILGCSPLRAAVFVCHMQACDGDGQLGRHRPRCLHHARGCYIARRLLPQARHKPAVQHQRVRWAAMGWGRRRLT